MLEHTVFVYGTLMRGYRNHRLLRNSDYLFRAKTEQEYLMYQIGTIPAVVEPSPDEAGQPYPIYGEVYRVSDDTLDDLDFLEGHPTGYERRPSDIVALDEEEIVALAWLYFWNGNLARSAAALLLEQGDWRLSTQNIERIRWKTTS